MTIPGKCIPALSPEGYKVAVIGKKRKSPNLTDEELAAAYQQLEDSIRAKNTFSEEEAKGWVIVHKSDVTDFCEHADPDGVPPPVLIDGDEVRVRVGKPRQEQNLPDPDRGEDDPMKSAIKFTIEMFQKKTAEAETHSNNQIAKFDKQILEASENTKKALKEHDNLKKSLLDSIQMLRNKHTEVKRQFLQEQTKLDHLSQQIIEAEKYRDHAIKIFDYVKTTVGIANAGFNQMPQI